MKALLVLVAMHVLNVFIVTLHTSERNTSNCSWTNTQKHFNQYNNMNILAMPCDMLLNHLWKLEKWEFEQSLPLSNNITSTSSLQISNNELIQSTNIIRIFQSTLFADSNQFKKNWHSKTLIIKRAADRSEYRLWTLAVINCFWCSAATSTNPTTSISAAAADFFTNPAISKHKFSQRQTRPSISLKVSPQFGKHCPMLQCLILRLCSAVDNWKIKGQRILGAIVQPAAIVGANCDNKSIVVISWHKYAFDMIEALLAQMRKMGTTQLTNKSVVVHILVYANSNLLSHALSHTVLGCQHNDQTQ
ncbi:hypothetical protein RFI_03210 [Reticulomyxa filosa]|uniref:Uncharacterized protein n=1 Tax=Reticulomyxa filosa TaxID=46433 RepID=X6P6U8_RETFI|nr:hypothetical protein RFI_03210 [Reticulomyxa filosa]|eukprot:ETO33886.1 hypothetical protein RFI_03210 [Reticulomyxa filosa]